MIKKTAEIILALLFVLYILLNLQPSLLVATMIDNVLGKILIFLIVIYLFINKCYLLGILSIWVFYDLIKKSGVITGSDLARYIPSEKKKFSNLTSYNQFPYTLEQEVVSKMTNFKSKENSFTNYSWKPNLEKSFRDAQFINKM